MDRAPIPDDVSRFILVGIPSVPYLEAMLLLRRDCARPWDAKRLSEEIYVSENAAQMLLSELHVNGVIEVVDQARQFYEYRPQSEALAQMINRLADAYSNSLVAITNLIHSKTTKKAQKFADAFIWRKDL